MAATRDFQQVPRDYEDAGKRGPAGKRIRLGVLTNPTALHNHRFPFTHRKLKQDLEDGADAVITARKSEVAGAVRQLLLERGVNVLGINGGDGTIHTAVNAIAGMKELAREGRFPLLLLLNGGTYNMASRAMGTKDDPVSTIKKFLGRYGDAPLHRVRTRRLRFLRVHARGRKPKLGMVFGSETVANALELCDELGSGYVGLARLLAMGTVGCVFSSGFYRNNAWRLVPGSSAVEVDGSVYDDAAGAVASTIDLKLAKGLVWALTVPAGGRGFHAKLVRAKAPGEVIRLLPNLLWELQHPMIPSVPDATSLRTSGRFTLDGEIYDHEGPVDVSPGDIALDVVSADGF